MLLELDKKCNKLSSIVITKLSELGPDRTKNVGVSSKYSGVVKHL